jgi:SAM-dependent methyltransferase
MNGSMGRLFHAVERRLPFAIRRPLRRALGLAPPIGGVAFGDLRRTQPIDPEFGFNRGSPVDRVYIDAFLDRHRADVRGETLEIGDDYYVRRYGGDRVIRSHVLHVSADNPRADFVGDLATIDHVPSDRFDCVILTQTLHLIYDYRSALANVMRILRPGGVLLITVPGITQIDRGEWNATWYWSFTPQSMARMLEETFGPDVQLTSYGNVLAATAFLYGLAGDELRPVELEVSDPAYPVIVAARVRKGTGSPSTL